jgi:hypothetical protein
MATKTITKEEEVKLLIKDTKSISLSKVDREEIEETFVTAKDFRFL